MCWRGIAAPPKKKTSRFFHFLFCISFTCMLLEGFGFFFGLSLSCRLLEGSGCGDES